MVSTKSHTGEGLTFNSWQRQGGVKNDYLYNGKEMQDELDLGWMDYGARMYDASVGRFTRIDSKSEIYNDVTPYSYTLNNPIKYIDPDGNIVRDADGNIVFTSDGKQTTLDLQVILV